MPSLWAGGWSCGLGNPSTGQIQQQGKRHASLPAGPGVRVLSPQAAEASPIPLGENRQTLKAMTLPGLL